MQTALSLKSSSYFPPKVIAYNLYIGKSCSGSSRYVHNGADFKKGTSTRQQLSRAIVQPQLALSDLAQANRHRCRSKGLMKE